MADAGDIKTRFDNENFETLARLAVGKFLQHQESSETKNSGNVEFESGYSPDEIKVNSEIWDEDATRLLDFACGPALISREFAPYVNQIVGVDISQEMVDIYNARVSNQGIPAEEMRAVQANVLTDDLSQLGVFDAAVCSMAYHHIDDIDGVTARIHKLLKPGGWYFVLDHEGGGHCHTIRETTKEESASHGVAHHHGLSSDRVVDAFKKSGFGSIGVEKAFKIAMWFTEDRLLPWVQPSNKHTLQSKVDRDGNTVYKVSRNLMIVSGKKSNE